VNRSGDDPRPVIFTIGHSNHPTERFIDLVFGAGIELVIDVRSSPASRHVPHFNRGRIEESLSAAGIDYLYRGDLLGGRRGSRGGPGSPSDRGASFEERFLEGIGLVVMISRQRRCALMCAVGDPRRCHRKRLIAPALIRRGVRVIHLLPDGTHTHEEEPTPRLDDRWG
jgi:uncharacterized protein (DUF488 family)